MKMATFEAKMGNISNVITTQRHLSTIKDAFMMTLPLTFIGSISLLISNPPIMNTSNAFLLSIKEFSSSMPILGVPYTLTVGIYGLWITLAVAYVHAKNMKVNPLSSIFIAAVSFLCIAGVPIEGALPLANIGSKGIFGGMLIGILTVEFFSFFIKKNIRIKMPDSVPPNISASFDSIIAFGAILFIFISANMLCMRIFDVDVVNGIMNIFKPLIMSSDTLLAVVIAVFIQRMLWFFGIHGGSVTGAILNPLLMANIVANQEAFAQGKELPHIFTSVVYSGSCWGLSFLGAAIVMIFFCKSAHLRTVGKLGIIPAFCGIGEPINFGTPFILNFALIIPSILHFVLNSTIVYLCMEYGLLNKVIVAPPLGTPTILVGFLASMDYRAIIIWILLLIMNVLIYIPFMKSYDRQLLAQEKNLELTNE